jgi:hypothetical protein
VTGALRPHDRQRRLCDPQGAEEVRLELRSHLVLREFLDHAEVAVAGVVDDDVELAEVVGGFLHSVEVGAAVGDIELNRQDRIAVGVDERG